jgi:hypothetical protein
MVREWFSWNAIAEQWSRFTESVFVRVKIVLELTTVFLTYNEDGNIGRALFSRDGEGYFSIWHKPG